MHNRWSSSLLKSFLKTLLVAALFSSVSHAPQLFAQTKENLHAQNPNHEKDQVHVFGSEEPDNRPFSERYAHPETISTFGHLFDDTFWSITNEGLFCFAIIFAVLLTKILFFRHSPNKRAKYFDGTSKAAVFGSIGFGLLVFFALDMPLIRSSYKYTHNVMWDYPTGPDVVKIMVMPQQWAWNFKYPGNDGKFNTDDDIDTLNELRVPMGKKVLLQIKSKDVIHGFMIPNLRYQIDAMPGHVTKFWFDTTKTGDFELACYHLCGTSHYKMKGFVKVIDESDFAQWTKENSEWAKAKYDAEDKQVHWGWAWGSDEPSTQAQVVVPQLQLKELGSSDKIATQKNN